MQNAFRFIGHRIVFSALLAVGTLAAGALAVTGAQAQTPTPVPGGFELDGAARSLRVTVAADGVFRVQMTAGGSVPENPSWAVIRDPALVQAPKMMQDAASFRLLSDGATLVADRKTLAVTVLDRQNRVVVQDDPHWLPEFHGTAFRVYKTMGMTEHFFGLGDKTGPTDHRDQAYTMWNTDAYHWQEATDPLYKSIPFFLAMHDGIAYGIFLDNTWRSSFDFGKESRSAYSFGAEAGQLDYYIVTGEGPKDIVRRYTALTGRPAMPPRWALGYQQSRWSYYPEKHVEDIATRLRAERIPTDVLYLDIDYQDRNRVFTIDRTRFPDFENMIAKLRADRFHVIAITDLHIANTKRGEYPVFDSGLAGDHFLRNADGSVYIGPVWPGPSSFPEFTSAGTRKWWGDQYRSFYVKNGIEGFWNDMNEPSVFTLPSKTIPLSVEHRIDEPGFPKRTATHAEIHNVMGMLNSRATYDGMLTLLPNQRPFVLTRASYAGGQRYAATWTGDNSATWNHLRVGTHQLINLGLSGFAFAGNDVGGYAGSPSGELFTRWMEIAAFAPIDRDHSEKGTADKEPWVGGREAEDIRRHYVEQRYRLLPYLYTLAEEASREGLPLMRPLFLEFPDGRADGTPMDAVEDSEFMLGPALLIAPPPFEETQDDYNIWLPENTAWFDFWTGSRVDARHPTDDAAAPLRLRQKHPPIDLLPVLVRAGSILPMQPLVQSTDEVPQGPLELRVYLPQADKTDGQPQAAVYSVRCEGSLYTDDGETFNFRKGDFFRAAATCRRSAAGTQVRMSAPEGRYIPWWKEYAVTILGIDKNPSSVRLDGKAIDTGRLHFDESASTLRVRIPATRAAWTLSLE